MSHQVRVVKGHRLFEQAVALEGAWEGRVSAYKDISVLLVFSRNI